MKLNRAARYFDKLAFVDAYQLTSAFKGQFDAAQVPTRDNLTDVRQVLSVDPSAVIPARRVVKTSDGLVWIVGGGTRDYFKTDQIRSSYVVHQSEELVAIKTFDQALQNQAGYQLYGARIWVKSEKEIEIDSGLMSLYDLYFALNEQVVEGQLAYMSGRWHMVRSTYPSAAGFLVAIADELPEPVVVTAQLKRRHYIPTTDDYAEAVTPTPALRIRWQAHFTYLSEASKKFKPGDTVLIIRKADGTPKTGDAATVVGEDYQVEAVLDEGAVWAAHLRHV